MNVKMQINHEGQTFVGEVEMTIQKGEHKQVGDNSIKSAIKLDAIKKPSSAIDLLYRRKFFFEPHTLAETWTELQRQGFNFSRPAILMALQAADYLTMTGKRGTYRFVQKFPPTD